MQCVASNSISCMWASVVLGYSRLEGRGYRHDRGTCVVSGPTQFDNFRCSWRVCAAIACHNNTHNCDVCFFRFPNENYGDRYVLIVSSMKLMYHKGWRTYVLSQILSVTHPPAVGLWSRCRPLTSVSFNYAPSLPPFMLPFRIIFDNIIYIIKLRMWRDGSRLAAVCLGWWKFVGPRRSSLHSVRFGQLLVTLCTSTHCQCNESVHRKEQLLFTPFMTV